jgi:hypothetical protein
MIERDRNRAPNISPTDKFPLAIAHLQAWVDLDERECGPVVHRVLDEELDSSSPEQPHTGAKSTGSSSELRTHCWREEGSRRHFHHLLIAALQGAIAAQTKAYAQVSHR